MARNERVCLLDALESKHVPALQQKIDEELYRMHCAVWNDSKINVDALNAYESRTACFLQTEFDVSYHLHLIQIYRKLLEKS